MPDEGWLKSLASKVVDGIYASGQFKQQVAFTSKPIAGWKSAASKHGRPTSWKIVKALVVESPGWPVDVHVRVVREGKHFIEVWRVVDGKVLRFELD